MNKQDKKFLDEVKEEIAIIEEDSYLKRFQKKSLSMLLLMYSLIKVDKGHGAMINLNSSVSSGKSTMALTLVQRWQHICTRMHQDTISIILTPGGEETLYSQWVANASGKLVLGNIYDFNSDSKLPLNMCYIIGYDKINNKDGRLKAATIIRRLDELTSMGVKLAIYMDEAHVYQTAQSAIGFYKTDYDCLFRMSATFTNIEIKYDESKTYKVVKADWDEGLGGIKKDSEGEYPNTLVVPKSEVYEEGLLKQGLKLNEGLAERVYTSVEMRERLLTLGHLKTQELIEKTDYLNDMGLHHNGKPVKQQRPLCLVVLGSGQGGLTNGTDKKSSSTASAQYKRGRKLLMDMGVSPDEIAFHISETDENFDKDEIVRDDKIRYLFILQSLRLGWNCPRLSVIVNHSSFSSVDIGIQLIGRGMRTPNGFNLYSVDEIESLKEDNYFKEICEEFDFCHFYSIESNKKNIIADIVKEVTITDAAVEGREVYKVSDVAVAKFPKLPVRYVKREQKNENISMPTVILRTRGFLDFFDSYLKKISSLSNIYTITDNTSDPVKYSVHNYAWMTGKDTGKEGNLVADAENKTFLMGQSTLEVNNGEFKEVTNDAFCITYHEGHNDVQSVLTELSGYLCVNKAELLVVLRNLFTVYNHTYKTRKLLFLESDSDLFQFIVSHRSFLAEMFLMYSKSANLVSNKKEYTEQFSMGSKSNNFYLAEAKKAMYDADNTLRRLNFLSSSTPECGTPVEVTTSDTKTSAFSSSEMLTVDMLEQMGKACKALMKFYHRHTQKGVPSLITIYEKMEERKVINQLLFKMCKDYISNNGKIYYNTKANYYMPMSFVMEYVFAGKIKRMDAIIQTVGKVDTKNGGTGKYSTTVKDLPEKIMSGKAYVSSQAVKQAMKKTNSAGLLYLVVRHEIVGKDKNGNDILNHYLLNIAEVNTVKQANTALESKPSTSKYWFKFENFDDLPLKTYYSKLFV